MRHLLPLASFLLYNLCCVLCLPIPAGKIVQYSVSSKYFDRNNSSSNSLYNLLSQIHYGGNIESSSVSQLDHSVIETTTILDDEMVDVANDEVTEAPTEKEVTDLNEPPEAPVVTGDVTSVDQKQQQQQQIHQQFEIDTTMKDNSADNDESFMALIEKVVSEQIEKLATETDTVIKINLPNEQKDVIEKTDLVKESNATSNIEKAQLDDKSNDDDRVSETTMDINTEKSVEQTDKDVEAATIPAMTTIIESVDLDSTSSKTVSVPTNQPEITTASMEEDSTDDAEGVEQQKEKEESNEQQTFTEHEKVSVVNANDNKYEIPETLMGAIGDLLSSVLGKPLRKTDSVATTSATDSDNENIHTTETIAPVFEDEIVSATTNENDNVESSNEQELSTTTSAVDLNENIGNTDDETSNHDDDDKSTHEIETMSHVNTNEVDLKIQNLASVQGASFMTENTPELYTETINEEASQQDIIKNDEDDNALEVLPALTVEEESPKPVSFQESVNHIMSLVRGTEDRLALENAENIVDSILIDHKTIDENVNQILKGALKEIETNFDMNESIDKEMEMPIHAIDAVDREREELINNFESDIMESLRNTNVDDLDDFEPNIAKAALYNRFQYGDEYIRRK